MRMRSIRQKAIYIGLILAFTGGMLHLEGQEVFFFRDSNNPGYYDSGLAFKTSPSTLEQTNGDKIPTSTTAFQGNNSLRVRWTSRAGGDWSALVIAPGFPFQNITTSDTLSFWAYAPNGLQKTHWPLIFMEGAPGATKSKKYPISDYAGDLPAQVWTQIKIPLSVFFKDAAQTGIQFSQTKAVIFGQGPADGEEHTLLIDEVKTYKGNASSGELLPPLNLRASFFEQHAELKWTLPASTPPYWSVYRSTDGGQTYQVLKNIDGADSIFLDFQPAFTSTAFSYYLKASSGSSQESVPSDTVSGNLRLMSDDDFLDFIQSYTFRYFWDFAHPVSGLSRERNTSGNLVTIGGSGFGIMAILVGIERGWITRAQGRERIQKMADFLAKANRFKGIFPHWMDGTTGAVIPFFTKDNGGDLVESAFLFQGLLTARGYFDQATPEEAALRTQITALWEAADWNWYRQNQQVLYWHWSPTYNFEINHQLRGWNETMIAYLLGIASPTHGISESLWHSGWATNGGIKNGYSYFDIKLPLGNGFGGPLFFTHYSFLGFDPRGKADAYANYFEHNRNQSLVNWTWCKLNLGKYAGYSAANWGLTASDDPGGYKVHAPASADDNGTITPSAALSSMPYTPQQSLDALKYFYREQGARLLGPMGFYDAFNLTRNWFADSYLAIDQGPIIGMIENYRTGLLWTHFMKNPEIQTALTKIGFTTVTPVSEPVKSPDHFNLKVSPNPAASFAQLEFNLPDPAQVQVSLYDLNGKLLRTLTPFTRFVGGPNALRLELPRLAPGTYVLNFQAGNQHSSLALFIQP